MKVDWDLSLAAHGESLEHVPQRFLISRGVEEKWPHYWVIFPQCTLAFSFFGGDFWRPRGLEGRSQPSAGSWPSWLHLVLLYLSSIFFGPWDVCHGNSPQRAVGGWPTLSSAFPSSAVMKGSLCPWSLTPDEETSRFQLQVLRGPHVPLLLHHCPPVHPNRASLN